MWAVVGNEIPQATFSLLFYYSIWNVFFTIKLGNDYEMLSNNLNIPVLLIYGYGYIIFFIRSI